MARKIEPLQTRPGLPPPFLISTAALRRDKGRGWPRRPGHRGDVTAADADKGAYAIGGVRARRDPVAGVCEIQTAARYPRRSVRGEGAGRRLRTLPAR